MIDEILQGIETLSDESHAAVLRRFFKTGPGEYGEGDLFRGIRVPDLRRLCRRFPEAGIEEAVGLLASPWHEDRLFALLLLVDRYRRSDEAGREGIFAIYCSHTERINNWDLVDLSAPNIAGTHLLKRDRTLLYRFAASPLIWERRIAVVSTFQFIRQGELRDTLRLSALLLHDPEELIHKAVGWMLREVGKRDRAVLEEFLAGHYRAMPRVMLRYAIERFPEELRQAYLKGSV